MSGVPVICSCLRLELTVERPFMPITIAAIPNAIRAAAATTPPISKNLRIYLLLQSRPSVLFCARPVRFADSRGPGARRHPRDPGNAARDFLAHIADIHLPRDSGGNGAFANDQHRS